MAICKRKIIIHTLLSALLIFIITYPSNANITFEKLENKTVSVLDFFLLKLETTLIKRAQYLRRQLLVSRVQYSNINIQVEYDEKKEQIFINMYATMDRHRYRKKNYKQKLSDCNQVRNLIFYKKSGYRFFTQKRDPMLSQGAMEDIFKNVFFHNLKFNEKEIEFLLNKIFVDVTILHPIRKVELFCYGRVNDYELK